MWVEADNGSSLILADPATASVLGLTAAVDASLALMERLQDVKAQQEDQRAGSLVLSGYGPVTVRFAGPDSIEVPFRRTRRH